MLKVWARLALLFWLIGAAIPSLSAETARAAATAAEEDRKLAFKREDPLSFEKTLGRIAIALVVVIGAGVAMVYVVRRYFPGVTGFVAPAAERRIRLIETRRLTPRATLYLIEIDGTEVLLAHSGESISRVLHWPKRGGVGDVNDPDA